MTAVPLEAERWYADKGRRAVSLEPVDALGELEIVRVGFADGGAALYTLVPDRLDWEGLLGRASDRFSYVGRKPAGRAERLAVDQSHSSWRVGDAHVKCYRRLATGLHPEVEVLAALTEAGFGHAPAYLGALLWEPDGGDTVAVAVVQEFVEDGEEGWEWGAELARAGESAIAETVGRLTRQLHDTLARSLPTRTATRADIENWREAAEAQLERAAIVERSVAEARPRARRELERLSAPAEPPLLARVHGDLHVGQILRARGRFVIVDFEGQPARSVEARRALDTQLRDLASLLRSLDHCGRFAVVRRGADAERTEDWIAAARARLLDGYGSCDESLLRALEWERALNEFTYAATYLPQWMYAPRAGFRALLREPEQ